MSSEKTLRQKIHNVFLFFEKRRVGTPQSRRLALKEMTRFFKVQIPPRRGPWLRKVFASQAGHNKNLECLLAHIKKQTKNATLAENILAKLLAPYIASYRGKTLSLKQLQMLGDLAFYTKAARVKQNPQFSYKTRRNKFIISINKAKPEVVLEVTARAPRAHSTQAPQCLLCIENVGWPGCKTRPSRANLLVKSLKLNGEKWFLQFSPYAYFKKHLIVISRHHLPMKLDQWVVRRFYEFTQSFPRMFISSNAGLKDVGGSILEHNHYQAGAVVLPIMRAPRFQSYNLNGVVVEVLDWPTSALKISALNILPLECVYGRLLKKWQTYDSPAIPNHNSNSFSLVFKKAKRRYHLWVIYRNNFRTPARPLGLFHIHPAYHSIKKEAMGVIEVAGYAVLPGRLEAELTRAVKLWNRGAFNELQRDKTLAPHYSWMERMFSRWQLVRKRDLRRAVGSTFQACLKDTNVFGNVRAFNRYISAVLKGV